MTLKKLLLSVLKSGCLQRQNRECFVIMKRGLYMRCFVKLLLLLGLVLWAPGPGFVKAAPQLDAEAMTILKKSIIFLQNLDRFEIQGTAVFDVVQEDGQRLQYEMKTRLIQQRPDKLYAEKMRDDGDITRLWYDGKQVSILKVGDNAYAQFLAPDTIDGMLDMMENLLRDPHPLADLLYSDLFHLLNQPESAVYVGPSSVGGFPCSHLAFRNSELDWQIWVERGDTPFIRKVVVTYRNEPGIPQYISYLHEWKIQPELNESVFLFSPPEKAVKLSILIPPAVREERGQP
jgi:hypothetical protein